jgi:hypothetical protein
MNTTPIHNEWEWRDRPAAQTRTRHRIGWVCSAVFCRIHRPDNACDDSGVPKKPRQTAT